MYFYSIYSSCYNRNNVQYVKNVFFCVVKDFLIDLSFWSVKFSIGMNSLISSDKLWLIDANEKSTWKAQKKTSMEYLMRNH